MGALLVLIGRIGLMALIYYRVVGIIEKKVGKIIDINDFPQDQVCYKFLGHIATCVYLSMYTVVYYL